MKLVLESSIEVKESGGWYMKDQAQIDSPKPLCSVLMNQYNNGWDYEPLKFIAKARGLPKDCHPKTRQIIQPLINKNDGDYWTSFVTLEEIQAYDWSENVQNLKVALPLNVYQKYRDQGTVPTQAFINYQGSVKSWEADKILDENLSDEMIAQFTGRNLTRDRVRVAVNLSNFWCADIMPEIWGFIVEFMESYQRKGTHPSAIRIIFSLNIQ